MTEAAAAVLDLSPHLVVVDDFLPLAEARAMRECIDRHFAEPHSHDPATHQLWNYWYVPGLYAYLRTLPERVIPRPAVQALVGRLAEWGQEHLGLGHVEWPYLSMYVHGCRQQLHNDSHNGRFGWVYSLTNDVRQAQGGETLVMRRDDAAGPMYVAKAGRDLYDLVPPKFNRLVLFDDRVPHAVQPTEGSYDPVHARYVIHSHVRERGASFRGPLPLTAFTEAVAALNAALGPMLRQSPAPWHGLLCLRIDVGASGRVEHVVRVLDRVLPVDGRDDRARPVRLALDLARGLRFPELADRASLHVPIQFGPVMFGR
jgi:hypothetical protein